MFHDLRRATYRRAVLARWKRRKGCIDCGYNKDPRALELDHRPGEVKIKTIASIMYSSWEAIKKEIAKCDVRCANCHAIRTHERKVLSAAGGTADTPVLETGP